MPYASRDVLNITISLDWKIQNKIVFSQKIIKIMQFSKEQEDIFQYAVHGPFNLIVQAVAGAGKTTTLVECVNRIGPDKRILLLAHNRSTRDTLKQKIGDRKNVNIFTLHGLGWRLYTEHFEVAAEIVEDKYRTYLNKNIDTISSDFYRALSAPQKMMYKANVVDLIDKARYNLKQSEKEIRKLAEKKYGMSLVGDEAHMVSNILKWGIEHKEVVDYQDLLWFPSQFGYFTKIFKPDVIMVDEAQDASIAQQDLIKRCMQRYTRLIGFGDKWQTINAWCGSDSESFEHFKDADEFRRPAVELPLTTCYRCGKKIIEYAKRYVENDIHARDEAEDGVVRHDASIRDAKDGDLILCRNIAPLMEVYRRGVANGQKMYFRGEELGSNLLKTADCAGGEKISDIIYSMKERLVSTWEFFTKERGLDERETMTEPLVMSLLDTIKTMENLPKTVETRKDLEKFSKDVFSNEGKDGIQLSTIHRAKGLEADNVFVVCPSLLPSRLATLDWQIQEEKNLQYVMCTRPKNSLNFVSEKELAPHNAYSEKNSLYKELNSIRNEVNEIKWV